MQSEKYTSSVDESLGELLCLQYFIINRILTNIVNAVNLFEILIN